MDIKESVDILRDLIFSPFSPPELVSFRNEMIVNGDENAFLKQFLRACDNKPEDAYKKYLWLYKFRKEHDIKHSICHRVSDSDYNNVRLYLPQTIHSYDKEGYPCYWVRFGQLDILHLLDLVPLNNILFQLCQGLEYVRSELFTKQSKTNNKTIDQIDLLVDLEGLGINLFRGSSLTYLTSLARAAMTYFPELLHKMIFVNCGWAFSIGWSIFQYIFDPETKKKIHVIRHNHSKELLNIIHEFELPIEFEGKCKCSGGCIPSKTHPHSSGIKQMDDFFKNNELSNEENKIWDGLRNDSNEDTCEIIKSHDNQWKEINLNNDPIYCNVFHMQAPEHPESLDQLIPEVKKLW